MGKKEIPARADLVDYNHTVAGHAGTMCDADGELFIKPCTQAEIDFYNSANENHPDFAELMPLFLGTLMLNDPAELSSIEDGVPGPVSSAAAKEELTQAVAGLASAAPDTQVDKDKWVQNKSKRIKTDQAVVLENSGSGFTSPNFLDVKLGERLWADDAPAEKKRRFDEITRKTTHGPLGFRIAGMKVWRGSTIKSELDHEDYKIYDKDYGRTHVNTENVVDNFRKFIFNKTAGIDDDLARAVVQAFLRDLRTVERVLASKESRMYSASLLFVFEGDGDRLKDAIAQNNSAVDRVEAELEMDNKPGRPALRVDSGIELIDEDLVTIDAAVNGSDEDDEDDEDDGPALPKVYSLKLIDFAHAQWTPGQGPDENTLKGVRSLIKIFEEMAQ
ncbi:inositol polyphosphate kinase [Colletotrichum eremochloae]|uniref:Kinase n=1 Tax=Colletotrichum sublineola TaxID=1173701 RepID=A0A066X585_COLSU|nr:inositol polyphosphate kinase [Colletotrichum sublineola]KAK2012876.1 inositol polyphosphate kinase [Colletotrichum eremochloae]KDN60916.1 putative inositol polyphosphate kinase [Colletotrichum sublineola]